MNEIEIKDASLEHVGVKGMRWGVRKQRKPKKSRTAAELAKIHRRRAVGFEVAKAVAISVGAVGVGVLAGPVVAAGAAAAARAASGAISYESITTDHGLGVPNNVPPGNMVVRRS